MHIVRVALYSALCLSSDAHAKCDANPPLRLELESIDVSGGDEYVQSDESARWSEHSNSIQGGDTAAYEAGVDHFYIEAVYDGAFVLVGQWKRVE